MEPKPSAAKTRKGSWVVTLPLAVTAAAYFYFLFLPGRKAIAELDRQVATERDFVINGAGVATALVNTQKELTAADAFVTASRQRCPGKNLPELYGKINELAQQAEVVTVRFEPQPVQPLDTMRRIPVTLACTGAYPQVHAFLASLERLPVSMWTEGLRVKRLSANADNVLAEVNLVIFSENGEISD